FACLWRQRATRLGLDIEFVAGDWRHGVDPAQVAEKLAGDREHRVKAVCVVHNETSTGVTTRIPEIRAAIDQAKHPALFMVDTISSLASIDYRHDEWGVDVTVAGSQKGLMLPPGLGFNAVSDKALAASKSAKLTRSYWDWQAMQETGKTGFFPYTPATNLLYGLREALKMLLDEEGLEAVFARHARHGEATRRAVNGWGLDVLCAEPREYSNSLTAVLVPDGHDADRVRGIIRRRVGGSTMTPEQIEMAAAALATARQDQPISSLPETARPQSEAECYAIQDAVLRRLGENIGGYKVGFSPEGGIFCAPIYASKVHASPARLPARGFHLIGIECEIGFRVNQALPARATPYSRDEVLAAASLH